MWKRDGVTNMFCVFNVVNSCMGLCWIFIVSADQKLKEEPTLSTTQLSLNDWSLSCSAVPIESVLIFNIYFLYLPFCMQFKYFKQRHTLLRQNFKAKK